MEKSLTELFLAGGGASVVTAAVSYYFLGGRKKADSDAGTAAAQVAINGFQASTAAYERVLKELSDLRTEVGILNNKVNSLEDQLANKTASEARLLVENGALSRMVMRYRKMNVDSRHVIDALALSISNPQGDELGGFGDKVREILNTFLKNYAQLAPGTLPVADDDEDITLGSTILREEIRVVMNEKERENSGS